MEVPIQPKEMPQPSLIINNMCIEIGAMKFNESAVFRVLLFPEGAEYIDKPVIKYVTIAGQEYLNWGGGVNGDNYIVNLICQKLGLTRK